MGSTSVDAVVSFAVAGVLMRLGLVMVLRGGAIARGLGFLCSGLAIVWAAEIVFLMSSLNHAVDHLVPAVSLVWHLQLGYFLLAGGALLGFLGGTVGLTVPRRAAMKTEQAPATPVPREKAAMPIADRCGKSRRGLGPSSKRSVRSAVHDQFTDPCGRRLSSLRISRSG